MTLMKMPLLVIDPAEPDVVECVRALGGRACLTKPVDEERLRGAIHKAISGARIPNL